MSKKHEVIMPMRYEIHAGRTHFLDDGTPIWKVEYTEYHNEEDYIKAKPDSVKIFNTLGFPMEWDDENFSASFNRQGPRDLITSIIAGEFLGRSVLGTMCFNDLLAAMLTKYASLMESNSDTSSGPSGGVKPKDEEMPQIQT